MNLDPNSPQNVSAAANALQAVGIAQTNNVQHQQTHQPTQEQVQQAQQAVAAQYAQQQLTQNQFYQQQVQQAQHRVNQQTQQLLNAVQQSNAYNHAAQQLVQHLPQSNQVPVQSFQPSAPQSEFSSRQELITYIHQYARENGFGIVISHSNEKAIYFTCELGGNYRNKRNIDEKERKRKLTTRKINCPFAMVANCKKNENEEVLRWVLRITSNEHNHDKMNLNESFPMLRRRNPEINRQIRELYLKGNKPLAIEKCLKAKFKDILINREDIYNETRKMKREEKLKNQGLLPDHDDSQLDHSQHQHHPPQDHIGVISETSVSATEQNNQQHNIKEDVFDQNIPNLLQANGIPLNLTNQYVSAALAQQQQQQQQQDSPQKQNNFTLDSGVPSHNQSVVNQAIANAQQNPPKQDLSNIDINLVKQQGL